MSFILDALRKSETERQQQTGPGLADSQYRATKTNKSIWIPLLVMVLAVNALVLAFVLNTDSEEPVSSTDQAPASRPDTNPDIRPLAREVPRQPDASTNVVAAKTEATAGDPEPIAAQADTASPVAVDPNASQSIQDGLPSFQQLILEGRLSVQHLHLDIHVFGDAGPERFVFINMKKYREGDTLAEGPSLEEITSTGVILAYRGDKFTLDRD